MECEGKDFWILEMIWVYKGYCNVWIMVSVFYIMFFLIWIEIKWNIKVLSLCKFFDECIGRFLDIILV